MRGDEEQLIAAGEEAQEDQDEGGVAEGAADRSYGLAVAKLAGVPAPVVKRARGVLDGITINGLVIGPDGRANTTKDLTNVKSLLGYYRSFVLRGPDSFAEAALDYADFERAMRRKLIRELRTVAVSRAGHGRFAGRHQ